MQRLLEIAVGAFMGLFAVLLLSGAILARWSTWHHGEPQEATWIEYQELLNCAEKDRTFARELQTLLPDPGKERMTRATADLFLQSYYCERLYGTIKDADRILPAIRPKRPSGSEAGSAE